MPDTAFEHDGQLTKRDVRAITLARLAPLPGELLWDVGAGCGSIGIEWMRAHPTCRAMAIEADEGRQQLIEFNRDALGVPGLQLVRGSAPQALSGLERPDAIFIGGGVTRIGVLETCWEQLRSGGRLVANAVTLQSEAALMAWRERHGGETDPDSRRACPASRRVRHLAPGPADHPAGRSQTLMRDETAEQPGLTTGSCATATSLAAARLLLCGQVSDAVDIVLPKGKQVQMRLEFCRVVDNFAEAGTLKDAGDDPDVTHGALVFARVRLETSPGVRFVAGPGVGSVTRPGLVLAVGEPAINPVPRRMMTEHLLRLADEADYRGGFETKRRRSRP